MKKEQCELPETEQDLSLHSTCDSEENNVVTNQFTSATISRPAQNHKPLTWMKDFVS